MLKFADKNEKEIYIYGDNYSEVMEMMTKVRLIGTTTYKNRPALIARKEEKEEK